jgi:hypothetical protein
MCDVSVYILDVPTKMWLKPWLLVTSTDVAAVVCSKHVDDCTEYIDILNRMLVLSRQSAIFVQDKGRGFHHDGHDGGE